MECERDAENGWGRQGAPVNRGQIARAPDANTAPPRLEDPKANCTALRPGSGLSAHRCYIARVTRQALRGISSPPAPGPRQIAISAVACLREKHHPKPAPAPPMAKAKAMPAGVVTWRQQQLAEPPRIIGLERGTPLPVRDRGAVFKPSQSIQRNRDAKMPPQQ